MFVKNVLMKIERPEVMRKIFVRIIYHRTGIVNEYV